jgi:F-type H+-transporting ATPase subunit b
MSKSLRLAALTALAMLPAAAGFAAEAEHGGGMPQLRFNDPMMLAQIIWLLIIFALLYVLMSGIALPRMAGVLEARRQRIEGDLDAARAAKDRADAALAEHQSATARARAEAQAAVAAAVNKAQEEIAVKNEALNARLGQQIEAAERQIAAARDAAMGALRQVSTETAEAVVARVIGQADRAAIGTAVDRELAARGHA